MGYGSSSYGANGCGSCGCGRSSHSSSELGRSAVAGMGGGGGSSGAYGSGAESFMTLKPMSHSSPPMREGYSAPKISDNPTMVRPASSDGLLTSMRQSSSDGHASSLPRGILEALESSFDALQNPDVFRLTPEPEGSVSREEAYPTNLRYSRDGALFHPGSISIGGASLGGVSLDGGGSSVDLQGEEALQLLAGEKALLAFADSTTNYEPRQPPYPVDASPHGDSPSAVKLEASASSASQSS